MKTAKNDADMMIERKTTEFDYFQTQMTRFKLWNLIPTFCFSHNVQGHSYRRNYSMVWLRWQFYISKVITTDSRVERWIAHEANVKRFMK